MKYHRWRGEKGFFVCQRCGVVKQDTRHRRRALHCPPTTSEKILMGMVFYGDLTAIDYGALTFPSSAVVRTK